MSAPAQITAYDLEDKKALGDDILTEDDLSTHDGHGLVVSAPTEQVSPLGYHVDWLAVIFLIYIHIIICRPSVAVTGLVVLGGHTSIENPTANFHDAFAGTTSNANGLANALVKVNFAYGGFENAFSVANEIKNPVRTIKRFAPISLGLVFTLYFLANIAYFASVPKEEIATSKELTASLFFTAVFRTPKAITALNTMIALSAFGMLLATTIGASRVVRECGRQGVLPFPRIWASTKPFNTPLAPLLLKYVLTVIVIIGPPQGDAFNFIVDLQSYPANVFNFLLVIGLFLVRKRRKAAGCSRPEFRAWNVVLLFALAVSVYLLVLPWVPPEGGIYAGDVSFFYATYCIAGIGFLALSGLAYLLWIVVLPRLGGYHVRQVVDVLDDGAQALRVVKVPNAEIAHWDATHDEHGAVIQEKQNTSSSEK
ncbi:hypothetical protein VNI00_006585 [Paramarasmius palmivorus]|uniref:High affinity methionine permease n=1 Tax=Paramarasmius palmivorus TaxID=297713 RepID=A0AAW0D9E6_9AGAR